MLAIAICIIAFLTAFFAGKKALGWGIVAALTWGYLYGIVRANVPQTMSHFIFDAATAGLYVSQLSALAKAGANKRNRYLVAWVVVLIAWPIFVSLLPTQPFLIRMVGLRGNVFFLPYLILGTRLTSRDISFISTGLIALNSLALAFAGAEFLLGVEPFFPRNETTLLIYNSQDVAGGLHRIPATFSNAHSFGGAMVLSIPFLFGTWLQRIGTMSRRATILAIMAAQLGVLLSATRLTVVILAAVLLAALLSVRLSVFQGAVWISALVGIGFLAAGEERLQRFYSLADTETVQNRLAGSVNSTVWDLIASKPFGNGMGGGGTSMPYFLQNQVLDPMWIENEFARIAAEQGIIGLFLWIFFIFWFLVQRSAFKKNAWTGGRRVAWVAAVGYLAVGMIGTGLMTGIPGAMMIFLYMGWTSVDMAPAAVNQQWMIAVEPRSLSGMQPTTAS